MLLVGLWATGLKILIYILSSKSSHEYGQKIGEFWRNLVGEESEAMAYEHNVASAAASVSSANAPSEGFVQGVTKEMRSKRQESISE